MAHTICDTWGRVTKEESRARSSMLHTIRLCYISRLPHGDATIRTASDQFAQFVHADTALSEAYALLSDEQRIHAREMEENPAVRVHGADGKEWWIDANLDLLGRLERGEFVGPAKEKQIRRQAGTQAF